MVERPAALRMHHALDEADIAVADAVIIGAVDVAGLVGIEMVAAMIGDPSEHRALHRHRADRTEERPHDRTAAKAPVHEQAMHARAHPEHGQPEHADEDRNLHPADALRECPDQRGDRTGVNKAEHAIDFANLGVHQRAFDEHARRYFLVRAFLRHHALNCGHFSQPFMGNQLFCAHRTDAGYFQQGPDRPRKSSPDERSDIRDHAQRRPRISRSLSSGAHSRDPLAHPGYACCFITRPWRLFPGPPAPWRAYRDRACSRARRALPRPAFEV